MVGPVALKVHRESRKETLRYYVPLKLDQIYAHIVLNMAYFSPKWDVLDLGMYPVKEQVELAKRVSMEFRHWLQPEPRLLNYDSMLMPNIWEYLSGVEELILIDNEVRTPDFRKRQVLACKDQLADFRSSPEFSWDAIKSIKLFTGEGIFTIL